MDKLRNLISQIIKELQEEDLEEITTTGDVDGYLTPYAFSKKKNSKKIKKISTNSTGFKIVKNNN